MDESSILLDVTSERTRLRSAGELRKLYAIDTIFDLYLRGVGANDDGMM